MGRQLTKTVDKRKPKNSSDAARPSAPKKGQRDAATVRLAAISRCSCSSAATVLGLAALQVRRLKMYSGGAAKRDKKGRVVSQASLAGKHCFQIGRARCATAR